MAPFTYDCIRALVVSDRTTRDPTPDECLKIGHFILKEERRRGFLPLGVHDVPGIGDVWFQLVPEEAPGQ